MFCGFYLPKRLARKRYPDGGINDPVHHGVRDGLLPDGVIPEFHWNLRSDDGGPAVVPVINDIHQQAAGDTIERAQCEVVQDQEVRPFDALEVPENFPGRLGGLENAHQPGRIGIHHPQVLLAGPVSERRRDESLAGSGAPSYEDVLLLFHETQVREPLHQVLVQAAFHGIIHILHGSGKPEPGGLDEVIHVPVVPVVPLVAGKHVHELVDRHVIPSVVLQARLESVIHAVKLQFLELLQRILVHFKFHSSAVL